jgi:perosamine synthetase
MMSKVIKLVDIRLKAPLIPIVRAIRSGQLAQGRYVKEFEESFARLSGVRHAIAVNNGTTALIAALKALDLKSGDEVITSPFTFGATVNSILLAGYKVRFADIEPDTYSISIDSIRSRINTHTGAIVPVHLYGHPCNLKALGELAREHSLRIVEDAAQAHGAQYDGLPVGTLDVGCFSFYATKNIALGEGGVVTTNSDSVADYVRMLRNQGMSARYEYAMVGENLRLTELQALIGLPQLEAYDKLVDRRASNAAVLIELLEGNPHLRIPSIHHHLRQVWHQFTIEVLETSMVDRIQLQKDLLGRGIESAIYYPKALNEYPVFKNHPNVVNDETPVAHGVARRCLSIPVHQHLSKMDLKRIAREVNALTGYAR